MKIDDSFKKPGAVPFKWEIRPGVPKIQSPQPRFNDDPKLHARPESPKPRRNLQSPRKNFISSPKLKPPPSGLSYSNPTIVLNPNKENSIKASPRTRSLRMMNLMRPDIVSSSSSGCFPSPSSVKRKGEKTKRNNNNDEYYSDNDLDHQPRWSVSSRKSFVSASPFSASLASYLPSPRLVMNDDEWANAVLMHF